MKERLETYSDEELLSRLDSGEGGEIMDYILGKYKSLVLKKTRVLYLVGGDRDDLVQEGMLGLFKAVRDYRPERDASFATFAAICIDRQLYQAIERSNRQKNIPLNEYVSLNDDSVHDSLHSVEKNPENIVIGRENIHTMKEQIAAQLSGFENRVMELYWQGKGYLEIADELGRPAKSIDNALQRIRTKMRHTLAEKENERK